MHSGSGNPLPPIGNTAKAATFIGIALTTLEKTRVYGGGPRFRRLGRSIRYRIEDLDAYLDAYA